MVIHTYLVGFGYMLRCKRFFQTIFLSFREIDRNTSCTRHRLIGVTTHRQVCNTHERIIVQDLGVANYFDDTCN